MAGGVSSLNPIISNSLSVTQKLQFSSHQEPSFPINSIRIVPKKLTQFLKFSIESNKSRRVIRTHGFDGDGEWAPEKKPGFDGDGEWVPGSKPIKEVGGGGVAATAVAEEEPIKENTSLKKALMDTLYGTDRGLKASSETRAEIIEIISQLEAKNPTPAPTEALQLLNGKWILAYTSFTGLFPLMASGTLPLVKVEEISQIIDSENFTVQNMVRFAGPLATTSLSTNAKFEVRSPKRVQIKFEQGVIGTPQLTDSIVLPESVPFMGRDIDLTPFKGLITSIQDTASSVIKNFSSRPPLKFAITSDKAQSWLLTTYLDGELRISRGDGGSVFVLIKEGSSLLKPSTVLSIQ